MGEANRVSAHAVEPNCKFAWRPVQGPAGAGAVQRRHSQVRQQRRRPGRVPHDGDRRLLAGVRGVQPQQDHHVHFLM